MEVWAQKIIAFTPPGERVKIELRRSAMTDRVEIFGKDT
jgi:hypothetical protein